MEDALLQAALRGSLREVRCRWCALMFCLCSTCDQGHRYCSTQCRIQARIKSMRAARRRYRHSPDGRRGQADRQQARRDRLRHARFVTDHGQKNLPTGAPPIAQCHRKSTHDPPESWRTQEVSNEQTTGAQSPVASAAANQQRTTCSRSARDAAESAVFAENPSVSRCARCGHSGWTRHQPLSQILRRAARLSRLRARDGALD